MRKCADSDTVIRVVMSLEDVHKACDKRNWWEDITMGDTRDVEDSEHSLMPSVEYSYSDTSFCKVLYYKIIS